MHRFEKFNNSRLDSWLPIFKKYTHQFNTQYLDLNSKIKVMSSLDQLFQSLSKLLSSDFKEAQTFSDAFT